MEGVHSERFQCKQVGTDIGMVDAAIDRFLPAESLTLTQADSGRRTNLATAITSAYALPLQAPSPI